jgi:uncharacterized delta-60 repeat protein
VVTVRGIISAPDIVDVSQDFDASLGKGTISNVPAGSDRTLTLRGLDTAGTVLYEGVTTGITVVGGQTTDAGPVEMVAKVAPLAPSGVSATAGNAQVTISWGAVSGATSYNLYFGTTTGVTKTTGTKVAGVTSPSTHTGLTNGTTYFYVVTAANAAGESAESAQVSATPVAAPGAPTGVSATPGNSQVTISWSAVTNATSYNLYFSTSTGVTKATGTKITGVTSNSYTHTGRTNNTTYYYVVTAVNASGESAESAQVSTTPGPAGFDLSFGTAGVLTDNATTNAGNAAGANTGDQGKAVGIDSTGRVVVAGWGTRAGASDKDILVWRFTSTGSADSAFGTSGVFKHHSAAGGNGDDVAEEFAFEAGDILVTGTSRAAIQSDAMVLMRVRDGTLVTSFGSSGIASYSPAAAADGFSGRGVVVDSSNRILITGSFRSGSISTDAMAIWRFSQTGSLDTGAADVGFGPVVSAISQGYLTSDNAAGGSGNDAGEAIVLDSQSRIVAAGYSQGAATRVGAVWRRQASGEEAADLTFNVTGQIFNTTTTWAAVTRDSSDRLFVAGAEGTAAPRDLIVQRITSTGTVDSQFASSGTFDFARTGDDYAQAIALDSTGRVLVAGTMQGSTGNADMVVIRLTTLGQLDTSFGGGSGFITIDRGGNEVAEDIAIDSQGRIFVVGHTTNTTTQISDMVVAKLLP